MKKTRNPQKGFEFFMTNFQFSIKKNPNNPLWIARYQLLINILIKKYN